jgi:predicted kinase
MILSFSGFSGVGKDTAAEYMACKYGYTQVSWATEIRKHLLNTMVWNNIPEFYKQKKTLHIRSVKEWELASGFHRELVKIGYDSAVSLACRQKTLKTIQRLHTDGYNVVISDSRREEEIVHCHYCVNIVSKNVRRPVQDFDDMISEHMFDYTIHNDGSLDAFRKELDNLETEKLRSDGFYD